MMITAGIKQLWKEMVHATIGGVVLQTWPDYAAAGIAHTRGRSTLATAEMLELARTPGVLQAAANASSDRSATMSP